MSYSTTYIRIIIAVLGTLGLVVSEDDALKIVEAAVVLAPLGHLVVERYKEGDLHWFGKRK